MEAGLSAGALYHYFASKEELFGAIADRFVADDPALAAAPETESNRVIAPREAGPGAGRDPGQPLRARCQLDPAPVCGWPRCRASSSGHPSAVSTNRWSTGPASSTVGARRPASSSTTSTQRHWANWCRRSTRASCCAISSGAFATTRARVLGLFLELLLARAVDDRSAAAEELTRSLKEIADP